MKIGNKHVCVTASILALYIFYINIFELSVTAYRYDYVYNNKLVTENRAENKFILTRRYNKF